MYIFLKRVTPSQEEPQAGTSGCIPEEGIVNIGDDSSMHVTGSEDPPVGQVIGPVHPPVGQDVEVEDGDIDDPDPV
jgi:hypothetical protein